MTTPADKPAPPPAATADGTPDAKWYADRKIARAKGQRICGYPQVCRKCRAEMGYISSTANWQNRVVCLSCGHKWSG